MGKRMTREEFLEAVFSRRYEELKGRELRTVRVRVVGKELSLAQLIGVTDRRVYENLGLHIGTHLGEDHTGQSIGLLHLTPWEATVVAADVAMKSGNVELGFLDRFSGAVILLGSRAADLRFHAGRDVFAEHPHLGAFAHEGVSKEQPQLAFFWIVVTEKLRKQQMRRNRDVSHVHGEAAVSPGILYIGGHISGIGGADIHDRPESAEGAFFFFYIGEGFIGCGVVIALAVEFIDAHRRYLVNPSCKNQSHSHRREAASLLPRAASCPSVHRQPVGTSGGQLQ